MEVIRNSRIRMGVDPLGGAGVHYWARIADQYRLDLRVVNDAVDPTVSIHDARFGTERSAWILLRPTPCGG